MVAATAFVFDDNLVGWRSTNRDRPAFHQSEDVGPLGPFANHQICELVIDDETPPLTSTTMSGPGSSNGQSFVAKRNTSNRMI